MPRYHPGTCKATDWGKRHGKNLEPKFYDDSVHQWDLAKDKNWGPWNCCGGAASSPGCQSRAVNPSFRDFKGGLPASSTAATLTEDKKYIMFLDQTGIYRVVADEGKCWRLDNERIAKKKTEGTVWNWVHEDDCSPSPITGKIGSS